MLPWDWSHQRGQRWTPRALWMVMQTPAHPSEARGAAGEREGLKSKGVSLAAQVGSLRASSQGNTCQMFLCPWLGLRERDSET